MSAQSSAIVAGVVLLCSLSPALHAGIAGEDRTKQVAAVKAQAAPVIDGKLNDTVWQTAPSDDRFTQRRPNDGTAPSVRTTVQVAYDSENIYFGIQAYDPNPEKISARLARRDSLVDSDNIEIYLDSRHDHDNGYWFRINAAGVLADAQIHDNSRLNLQWNAVWRGAAHIHKTGWSAEISIPLSVLRFSKSHNPLFGLNLKRTIRRSGEVVQWAYSPRNAQGTLSRSGHIANLHEIAPQRVVHLQPFGVLRFESELQQGGSVLAADGDKKFAYDLGLDAKLGLSDGLTLDVTINPDFGQVEADPVQLNLSTFEAFFTERRPFFLEGAGLFGTDIGLIHARRIGQRSTRFRRTGSLTLSDGQAYEILSVPQAIPIYAAARISGTLGKRFSLTALNALTAPELVTIAGGQGPREIEVAPSRNYAVARGKFGLGGSSYLGFVGTAVNRLGTSLDPAANHDSSSQSIDGRWVRQDGRYRAYFQLAAAQRGGGDLYAEGDVNCNDDSNCRPLIRRDGTIVGPNGSAGEFGAAKAGGALRLYSRYRFISPNFNVGDMGFENDWDTHQFVFNTSYNREKEFSSFQRARVSFNAVSEYLFDGTRKQLRYNAETYLQTKNFWDLNLFLQFRPGNSLSSRETADGGRFEQSDQVGGYFDVLSDTRGDYNVGVGAEYFTSPSTELSLSSAYLNMGIRPTAPLELKMQAKVSERSNDLRVVDCQADEGDCWQRSLLRTYTLALQDSQSFDLTARFGWALSTTLTFEGYMQLFAAGSELSGYRELRGITGSTPTLLRNNTTSIATPDNPEKFSFATLNANLILRWEWAPGATIIGVYTRSGRHGRQQNRLAFAGLRNAQTEEIFLVKLTIFAGL
ncbi:MAG: carbohydrate binding family 9 domain-containing protein [Kofleriaceae bacterium]|nr:carbohydrate binding family 9 domain-containing protein [Kofleriaceae bacterium]